MRSPHSSTTSLFQQSRDATVTRSGKSVTPASARYHNYPIGLTPIVVFDLDNTLVHSRIDFLAIRQAIIGRLVEVGALDAPPEDPRTRAIPEWLDLAAAYDPALAAELWAVVDRFERDGMVHGTVEADARTTLDQLSSAGLKLAVLTNNSLGSADAALERFDLRQPLDLVLARDVVAALKPSGAGVAQAHAALGGGPLFMVGVSWIDGAAAQRAAIGAAFIAFRANLADLAARGIETWSSVSALAEIPALVDRLERSVSTL
jgi:phosphoglycolate phosphatase